MLCLADTNNSKLKLGQHVQVTCDFGSESKKYDGKISWMSETAEFSSKIADTKEERDELVYAIKIAVHNDGFIKTGMYGEVML